MKRLFILFAVCLMAVGIQAQGYYTKYYGDRELCNTAQKWMKSGQWRNGFSKADPHETVNAVEFYLQYQKNPDQWKAMFEWLEKTDLLALPKGRIPIPGTTMVASVEDDTNRELEGHRAESHYHHIDFQYVVKGSERFGIVDHYTSTINTPYKPDFILYNFDKSKTRFYDSTPSKFFLFFPDDWHIAKVKTDKDDQNIRVIVVKVDYL
jgi:biofilm protein TabA